MHLHEDVVDRDMDQLDNKANDAHNEEAHGDGLSDLHEFYISARRIHRRTLFSKNEQRLFSTKALHSDEIKEVKVGLQR